jgi:hypothetical protein
MTNGMNRAHSGLENDSMATVLGLNVTEALDTEMMDVGYAQIHGIRGRIPESQVDVTAGNAAVR